MKSAAFLALWCFCSPLAAQVGAKADQIVIPRSFGSTLVLKHCEALEVKSDGIKVKHDDGSYVVPTAHLPEAWKKAMNERKAANSAAEKQELEQALKAASTDPNWKTSPPPEGWEILRVRVVSVWVDSWVVELFQRSQAGTANGYNPTGKMAVLSGVLAKEPEDNQMYTVLAKKGDTRKFQGRDMQGYLVSRYDKGVAP